MQIIFHIDLNAFYASAEISRNPNLEGKPLVISGKSKRSIITTASYEARKFGIHSAMPLFQAYKKCKNLIVLPADFELYHRLSNEFFSILSSYSEILEVASIDECYVDVTKVIQDKNYHPVELARRIQNDVYEQLNLKCSIGISPNKFLAKMASDMKKPMGITILTRSNLKELMWPLDIKNMFGIGKKTQPRLREVGIMTIGDIANYNNYNKLRQIIGKNALLLYRRANGIDNRVVDTKQNELKSVGNSITLPHDTLDEIILLDTLKQLARQVSMRAAKRNLISNSISITIKYTRFESVNRQTTINSYINDYEYILSTAKMLFDAHYDGRPVRLLGISLNNTINKKNYKEQLNIFNSTNDIEKDEDIQIIIENINNKFEKTIVTKASDISKKNIQKKYLK
ncbi:DNA polymerase IV [Thomasclavelia cocleata]|uniref:DNA polymerase IV n=1 Tax=Thomasclavelia cocleata TaxID=69824 RepID=A0A1I0BC15_9FIRM|nr:DNA polymerase IV [Thomasclavelia cocleata]MCR1959942.1 DNA polymerase IV [Thomasclavelia cocleata]NDO41715.1 DNA polymerase IV [Thomasclavelia cocleata]PJN79747.1 DNA polymerase IV [Thomasclavelia cocleata]SET04301.1 DNA polymerase-4 [Thomasclavelia cocleata]